MVRLGLCCHHLSFFVPALFAVSRLVIEGRFSISLLSQMLFMDNQIHSQRLYYTVTLLPTDRTYCCC